jgi:hypothetical protein
LIGLHVRLVYLSLSLEIVGRKACLPTIPGRITVSYYAVGLIVIRFAILALRPYIPTPVASKLGEFLKSLRLIQGDKEEMIW